MLHLGTATYSKTSLNQRSLANLLNMATPVPTAPNPPGLNSPFLDPTLLGLLSEKDKKELITANAMSLSCDSSSTVVEPSESSFHATKTLDIAAEGIPVLRLPCPSSELGINIYNSDKTLAYSPHERIAARDIVCLPIRMGKVWLKRSISSVLGGILCYMCWI